MDRTMYQCVCVCVALSETTEIKTKMKTMQITYVLNACERHVFFCSLICS